MLSKWLAGWLDWPVTAMGAYTVLLATKQCLPHPACIAAAGGSPCTPILIHSLSPFPTRPPPLFPTPLQVVGVGGTTAWKLCTLSAGTCLAVVYDIVAAHGGGNGADPMATQQFFIQFVTRYLHDSGSMRCRVTTITRR